MIVRATIERLREIEKAATAAPCDWFAITRVMYSTDPIGPNDTCINSFEFRGPHREFIFGAIYALPTLLDALTLALDALEKISDNIHTLDDTTYCSTADKALAAIEKLEWGK